MSYSEKILEEIFAISQRDSISIFEATAQYCEDIDTDPQELIESLDPLAIEQIKASAIHGRHVRQCVHKTPNTLPL